MHVLHVGLVLVLVVTAPSVIVHVEAASTVVILESPGKRLAHTTVPGNQDK